VAVFPVFPASDVTLRAPNILGAAEKNDVVTGARG
jgi:hypothetical protein